MSESLEIRYLMPAAIRFFMGAGMLRATLAGECSWLQVTVRRVFPLTRPDKLFSVRDGGGKEIGLLVTLDGLDPESVALVRAELARRYVTAQIRRIRLARERFGVVEWDVETDRGPCRFTTRDLRDQAIRLPGGGVVIVDVEGNRFEVGDLAALDARSVGLLMKHL